MKNLFREGQLYDIWSIPHFLSGYLIGFPLIQYDIEFATVFIIVIVASIIFELIEIICKVKESTKNKIIDLTLGILGYIIGYYLIIKFASIFNYITISIAGVIYLSIVIPGWIQHLYKQKTEIK